MEKYYVCITPFFPSPNIWRGAYVFDQVKAIRRNSDYELVVFKPGKSNEEYIFDGIKVYIYKTLSFPSNIFNGFFNNYNAKSLVRRVLETGVAIEKIAIVHCHVSMQAACGLALKRLNPNIKVLLQHHDLDPFNLRSGIRLRNNRWNIRYRAEKAIELYNQVDLHVCISQACKDSLLSFPQSRHNEIYDDYIRAVSLCNGLPCVKPKATYVLYNGVDTNLFKNNVVRRNSNIFRIGCIANFNELKGHITLLKAFNFLVKHGFTNLELSLLGNGEMKQMCMEYVASNNLGKFVEWQDEVTHEKLPDYYHSLDLFVLPSYFEGFGCVFTEAAACGVPFMGCKNQGYSEYIPDEDKDKWLIEPHDYKQLAENIKNYVDNKYVQTYCHTFDIDVLINEYLKAL